MAFTTDLGAQMINHGMDTMSQNEQQSTMNIVTLVTTIFLAYPNQSFHNPHRGILLETFLTRAEVGCPIVYTRLIRMTVIVRRDVFMRSQAVQAELGCLMHMGMF